MRWWGYLKSLQYKRLSIYHLKCRLYSTSFKLEVYNSALPIVADRVYLFLDRVIGVETCEIALNLVVVPYPLNKLSLKKGLR